ncbi:phospholipase [Clostridium carboxidivorans P7]|uniref:Patatin n=1 Tax=Clostridium carboxidivorans P7 TaxID=536227 RepID=C6PX84_9CLOT|nr:patatin-like phospholipase family protein [Clostridium carboxidivorans]AKN32106.1 phospholipase [Clostridium carboxidivorans P7]EET86140.1 Patatin [Clostridium carboxidivorans P7]EFG88956.1 phospholipase, patatin family [Clostridium carboxidivorans P7]
MKAYAVFQGGGVKAIGFVGAITKFEQMGYKWEKLAGTSAGAIIASLLAVGYTSKELKNIMSTLDYTSFLDKNRLQSLPIIGKVLGVVAQKGLYQGKYIETWIDELLKAKGKTKFKDVSKNGVSNLKIIASDITKKSILILPDDLIKYGIDPMEFEIAKAVRMSTSIPFYFKPEKLRYRDKYSFIVDGGILSNFPVWIFDVTGVPKLPTFGFKFQKVSKSCSEKERNDFLCFVMDLVESVIDNYDETYLTDKDRVRTISIPTADVKTTDFDIKRDKSLRLFDLGYESAERFLNEWDFREYIRCYVQKKVSI